MVLDEGIQRYPPPPIFLALIPSQIFVEGLLCTRHCGGHGRQEEQTTRRGARR